MIRTLRQVLILCFLAALPAAATAIFHPHRPSWSSPGLAEDEVMLETVFARPSDQVLWIDARAADAYEQDHIPGSLLLNEDAWEQYLPHVIERWQPGMWIVVYCDSQACNASRAVANRLRDELAWDLIYILHDGWRAWLNQNP